ncbi:MAG TPA: hypothetical protein VMF65_12105 [Acidimicrobiales bacterium]|nr:hypothetical protein [Acidimicrobiales bacterium]
MGEHRIKRADPDDVLSAVKQYHRLGPERFFAEHGSGPSRSYELVWEKRAYPHKAILGTAYELATGKRLAPYPGSNSLTVVN